MAASANRRTPTPELLRCNVKVIRRSVRYGRGDGATPRVPSPDSRRRGRTALIRNYGGGQHEAWNPSKKTNFRTASSVQDKRSASETVHTYFVHVGDTAGNRWKRRCCPFRWRSHHEGLVRRPTHRHRRSSMEGSEQDGREERIERNCRPPETG